MRRFKPALAAAVFSAATVAFMVPTTAGASAGASPAGADVRDVSVKGLDCKETRDKYGSTGKVYMYRGTNCAGSAMCKDYDNDSNYATGGACTGSDNDDTSSVLNLGWKTGGRDDVRFYTHSGYRDNIGCVMRGAIWYDVGGAHEWKDNVISSHKWAKC